MNTYYLSVLLMVATNRQYGDIMVAYEKGNELLNDLKEKELIEEQIGILDDGGFNIYRLTEKGIDAVDSIVGRTAYLK